MGSWARVYKGSAIVRVLKAADAKVEDLAFSPDGSAIAAGTLHSGIFLWNLEAVPLSPVQLPGERYKKGGLHFSSDSRSLVWLVTSWLATGPAQRCFNRDSRSITDLKHFAETKRTREILLTSDGEYGISLHGIPEHRLYTWRHANDMWVQTGSLSIADISVDNLAISEDGQLFTMLSRSALDKSWEKKPRQVEVHEARTAALRGTGEYPYKYGGPLLFSPDSSQLVGFNNMNLLVWRIPERGDLGTPRLVRNTTRKQFTAISYHPSGRHLYVTSNGPDARDATVQIFDTTTWTRVEQFTWQLGNLKSVAVSPDGTLAAAGGDRGDIVIWDVDL
jgi:WD40 repeat protein